MNSTSLSLAMQKKVVVNEVRTPTNTWSGLGFSKSMPVSAIKELVSRMRVSEAFLILFHMQVLFSLVSLRVARAMILRH